jgi:hypothetical protein
VTPIFKKSRRNKVKDYRGLAILSAIQKRFELLVYKTMYDDLKNLISVNQHELMKNRSTVTNLLEYASFVLNSNEEGWQVDSVYTDFSKTFDRLQLLLEEMSVGIEPARCWFFWKSRNQYFLLTSFIESKKVCAVSISITKNNVFQKLSKPLF